MQTKSTIIYKKWDIILVPFPFTDLSSAKKRPALIISPDLYNSGEDILIAFITSNIPNDLKIGDYLIKDWKSSGLPLPSLLKLKLSTVHKAIIVKTLGTLSKVDREGFQEILINFFK